MPTTEDAATHEQVTGKNSTGDNPVVPFKQAITTIEHKIKTLEKQKAELESYHGLQNPTSKTGEALKPMYKSPGPGAGFMDSFLKFLQTERDNPPPNAGRGRAVRKQRCKQTKSAAHQNEVESDTNGINAASPPITRLSQGDSQDNVPKERKRTSFDSSDDGFSSDDENKKHEPPPKEKNTRRGRAPKAEKKKGRPNTPVEEQEEEYRVRQQRNQAPRRESSKRAAKDRCVIKRLMAIDDEMEETSDSGSDPAWTPQVKEDHHEDDAVKPSPKKGRRGRPPGRKKAAQNTVATESEEAGVEDADSQLTETAKGSDPSQAEEHSEDDPVKSLTSEVEKERPAEEKECDIAAPEEPDAESETTQKPEESKDSGSDSAQAKEEKAEREKTPQSPEDIQDQATETTDNAKDTSNSDSDPAWTPPARDSEEDLVKSPTRKRMRVRSGSSRRETTAQSSEESREDIHDQATETAKDTSNSDSDPAWTPHARDSEEDVVKSPTRKGMRVRSGSHRRETTAQSSEEDIHDQAIETTNNVKDTSNSDSDPAWTPHARDPEEDLVKSPTKKGKRVRSAGQRKIVALEEPECQPIEATTKSEEATEYDSDPAWTPLATSNSGDDVAKSSSSKVKRGRPVGRKKPVQNSEDEDADSQPIETTKRQRITNKRDTRKVRNVQALEKNAFSLLAPHRNSLPAADLTGDGLFKFVVIKSDLKQEWPALWRVDGRSLLQKFEPFVQDGQMLYRNISTFISWTPENKNQYIIVPVKIRSQSRLETVVEFLKSEMTVVDYEFLERTIKETEVYQDCFEVYIQALISQALDSNFLKEIIQEHDDYFLSRVKAIDEVTDAKKQKLLRILRWPPPVEVAVNTWPCFNVIRELSASDAENISCAACFSPQVSVQVLMYGQPYNSTTLEGCQPDPHVASEKNFLLCRLCANRVNLFNRIAHQKYLMYIECAKRVAIKRAVDPRKDTTCILNEFLADDDWLNQLFLEARRTWGEVDSLDYNYNVRHHSQVPVL